MKLYFLDKWGWPVERIKGRYVVNFLRLLIYTRKIATKKQWETRLSKHMKRIKAGEGGSCSQQVIETDSKKTEEKLNG